MIFKSSVFLVSQGQGFRAVAIVWFKYAMLDRGDFGTMFLTLRRKARILWIYVQIIWSYV